MTPGTRTPLAPKRLVGILASLTLLASLAFVVAPAAASDGPCAADSCDDGAWAAARGPMNEVSFWGMSAGHNCTNYVAWRLTQAGVEKPATHPGNAVDWADNAALDGYRVDDSPSPGAVAHWDSFASGYGALGHVAYVERVNDDGTLLVAEDYWRNGEQTGPLTYRLVDAASVSQFIHYGDERDWLRTASLSTEGWVASSTHLDIEPTTLAAVTTERGAELFYTQGGRLWQASGDETGWTATDTGLNSDSPTLSAVVMAGRPYVMSLNDGELVMSVRTESGWQQMVTGVKSTGELAAVDLGGLTPTVFVSEDNRLWRVWGDPDGWHVESTDVRVTGAIAALVDDVGNPVVFNVRNGALFRHWFDWTGWHTEQTAVLVDGRMSVAQTAAGPEIFFLHGDTVHRVRPDGSIWVTTETGLDGGALLSVVDQGGSAPLVIQVG